MTGFLCSCVLLVFLQTWLFVAFVASVSNRAVDVSCSSMQNGQSINAIQEGATQESRGGEVAWHLTALHTLHVYTLDLT